MTGILAATELDAVQATFGVAEVQVGATAAPDLAYPRRTSQVNTEDVMFFGCPALCRTHLPDHRLSEDIDLVAAATRSIVADDRTVAITRRLRRSLGLATFGPPLSQIRDAEPSMMTVAGLRVQIQILTRVGYPP